MSNGHEAWDNDPSFVVLSSDDPASIALKKGLALWIWPGYAGLAVALITAFVFQIAWAVPFLSWGISLWLAAQFIFRPAQFADDAVKVFLNLREIGTKIVGAIPKPKPKPRQARAPLPETPPPLQQAFYEPPKQSSIDWGALFNSIIKFWWVIPVFVIGVVALKALSGFANWIGGPSGREVQAEASTRAAESRERTADAEADMGRAIVPIIEEHTAARVRVQRQVETTRAAIENAPDLQSRYSAYRGDAERLRDEGRSAAAAAVSALRAELDP